MTRKEEVVAKLNELEAQMAPLRNELHDIHLKEVEDTDKRIKLAERGKGDFKPEELRYASHVRCECGAGMAYPVNVGFRGAWICSNILLGKASTKALHTGSLPFSMYEIKSEDQPSANGATTRPEEAPMMGQSY